MWGLFLSMISLRKKRIPLFSSLVRVICLLIQGYKIGDFTDICIAAACLSWMGGPSMSLERPGFNSGLAGKLGYRLNVYVAWSSNLPSAIMQWRGA
jgi:hypothetical protein